MKSLKFLSSALFCGLLAVSSLTAKESIKATSVEAGERNVRAQIVNLVSNIAIEDTGAVYIKFKVSADKGFQLVNVNGNSSVMASNVERAISRNTILAPALLQGQYVIKIRFVEFDEQNRVYASR